MSSNECSQAAWHMGNVRRVAVVGTSGSGKSTLARAVAARLGVVAVELDAIRHGPNWRETPDDVFRRRVAEALAGDVWVVDGNYTVARDLIWERATTLIWLDYPFPFVFWRLFWRTMSRGVLRKQLWNGNREDLWRHFLTRDSLFLWAAQTHWRRRKTLPIALAQPQYGHLRVMRFRRARQTREWLAGMDAAARDDISGAI